MPTLANPWIVLLAFVLAFALLVWLNLQINTYTLTLAHRITGSIDMATVILFLIYLPGIFLHEGAHWLTAWVFGLHPSKFRVWPKRIGRQIGLGSVQMRSGGIWLDTLVGMAPLIAGTTAIALIGHVYFDTVQLLGFWGQGHYIAAVGTVFTSLGGRDGGIFAYLLFAISNAMLPSASDREPLLPVLGILAVATLLYLFLDLPTTWLPATLRGLLPQTEILVSGFFFVIVLDTGILAILLLVNFLVSAVTE